MQIYLYAVGFLFIYCGLLSIIIVVVVVDVTLVAVCFVCLLSSNGLKPLNKCKKKKGNNQPKCGKKIV